MQALGALRNMDPRRILLRLVAVSCALAATAMIAEAPLRAATAQPAAPNGELGCYYILGIASGYARSVATDRSTASKKRKGATNAREGLRWYQQWYLGRLSAWPNDRHEPAINRPLRSRLVNLPTKEAMRLATVCVNWANEVNAEVLKSADPGK